uniref:Uncharacterized protein n=1 Tax=Tanacetum cinerariifolium TaxID=118510 RepID=A0A699H9I3_TANCI|nr:hypothetical protein [Tanacetum cinerariifolium]
MALSDKELTIGKNHARNGEWIDITMRKNPLFLYLPRKFFKELHQAQRTVTVSETEPTTPLVHTEVKDTEQESKINELTKLVQMVIDEKDSLLHDMQRDDHRTSDHKISRKQNQILSHHAHYGFNNNRLDDCRNYPECGICGSYDHFTSGHNRVIYIRGGVLAESSHSSESLIGVKCNTCRITVHSTTDHNKFDHFKRGQKIQAIKAESPLKSGFIKETDPSLLFVQIYIREPIWYLDSGCSRSMTGVKSYLHKYVEQPSPKVVFGDNSSGITEGYGSINYEEGRYTYHVTFNESMEAIRFTNTSEDEIGIDDSSRWSKDEHIKLVNIIGDPGEGMLTKSMAVNLKATSASECLFTDFLSKIEPKKVSEALKYLGWVDAMNKKYEHGITTKNKARLVAQGYSKKEGINYDETFARVARMEAIGIFLIFATYMNFKVYQTDVKITFLNALYGLKQELRAWYETLSTFLIQNEFTRGRTDNILFIYKSKGDVLLVQISVQSKGITSNFYEKNPHVPERKITSSAYQILGRKLVCWSAKKQQSMAISSAEAEYVTAVGCYASITMISITR